MESNLIVMNSSEAREARFARTECSSEVCVASEAFLTNTRIAFFPHIYRKIVKNIPPLHAI